MIVGLDVSTSYVGIAIIDSDSTVSAPSNIVLLDHLDFKGCLSLLDKTDRLRTYLTKVAQAHPGVKKVVVEDAAKRYASGSTSIATIGTLIRFNGLATYLAYDAFDVRPTYIAAMKARSACGIKVKSRKKTGLSQKEQAFRIIMATDLSHIVWPLKARSKKKEIVPWAYDVVDAYVTAKSEHAGLSVPA